MRTDKGLMREFLRALAAAAAGLAAAGAVFIWAAAGMISGSHNVLAEPERTAADVDRLFEQNAALVSEAMDILWRHHELLEDLMLIEGRLSNCEISPTSWSLEEINHRIYMTDEEWQIVRDMEAAMQPSWITYYAEDGPSDWRHRCHAWSLVMAFQVPDEERRWEDGWQNLYYIYGRCTEADHEGFNPACGTLKRHLVSFTQRLESCQVWDTYWFRGTRWRERLSGR